MSRTAAGRGRRRPRNGLGGYVVSRAFAAAAILAAGAAVSVAYNLMSPRGVLSRAPNAVAPSAPAPKGNPGTAPAAPHRPSRKAELLPNVAATAVVLVSQKPGGGKAQAEEGPAELRVIDLATATKYLAAGGAIFVDARSRQRWEMGHVPGALDVPSSDFENGFAAAEAKLARDATIVVYCESASCDQAEDVAQKLIGKGYRHVLHFKDGWLVWEFSNQPAEKSGKWR